MLFKPSEYSYGDSDRRDAYYAREMLTTYRPAQGYGMADWVKDLISTGTQAVTSQLQSKREQQLLTTQADIAAAQARSDEAKLAAERLQMYQGFIKAGQLVGGGLVVGGVAWALWHWMRPAQ